MALLPGCRQFRVRLGDATFQFGESGQFRAQVGDAPGAIALQVAVIGQQAVAVSHAVLRQHQLQGRVAADGVRRAQQLRQFASLRAQGGVERAAPRLQGLQFGVLPLQLGFHLLERTGRGAYALVELAQLARGLPALAFDPASLARDSVEFFFCAIQFALGVARVLRRGRERDRQQRRNDQRGAQQPHANNVVPVISTGCGRPSRSSRVGATSRSAPPLRRVAPVRSPT